mmetsp:Transcript_37203/g.107156  ORF Transcript_37203/g.107156 Transcript_37203/m.107156 type:complete len:313 (-) Transcript_37203:532-1470(-)
MADVPAAGDGRPAADGAKGEALPCALVRPLRVHGGAANIDVPAVEHPQADLLAVEHPRLVRRRRIAQFLQWILAAPTPRGQGWRRPRQEAPVEGALEVPLDVVPALCPIPEEVAVRRRAEGRRLRPAEDLVDLVLGHLAARRPRGLPHGQAPLADDHGVLLQHPLVGLHMPQLLRKGLAVELVLEAVVAMHVEAYVLVRVAEHQLPLLRELVLGALEHGQHCGHTARRHAASPDGVDRPAVVLAEPSQRRLVRRLVADGDSRDAAAVTVAPAYDLDRLQREVHVPMLPLPSAMRALPPAARRLPALAAGAAV